MIYDYPYHRNYFNKYNMYYKNNYLNNNSNNYYNKKNDLIKNIYLNNSEENVNNKYYQENNIDNLKKTQEESRNSSDDTIINVFGIKLAFDDLIILGLLYLLYTEDVKDISLYIVLILLLLN